MCKSIWSDLKAYQYRSFYSHILAMFPVLIHVLLSKIWCKSSISDTVSHLMQLTCAPVSKRDENARSFTLILKIVPFVLPVFITNTSFSTVLLLTSSVLVSLTSQDDEFPNFLVDSLLSSIDAAFSILVLGHTEGLHEIVFSNFIYLFAAPSLLFQLILFKPHGKVKLSEEVTTKLSGHIVVKLLSQCDF